MMNITQTLASKVSRLPSKKAQEQMYSLKLKMLRYQKAAFIAGQRIVVVFEGFDAAGKGTCIRHLTESLDPRSAIVVPVGKPTDIEMNQHYLQRFWNKLPQKGQMVVFDRSWYGRVLVEKVEKLAPPHRIEDAYREINQFEKMLKDDGVILIKIFLVVSKHEQLRRFHERLENPLKGWKITEEDVRNRKQWASYVKASDIVIKRCPGWKVIPSDNKAFARLEVLKIVTNELFPLKKLIPKALKPGKKSKLEKELLEEI